MKVQPKRRISEQYRTGIDISKAKRRFKLFFLLTLCLTPFLIVFAIFFFPDYFLTMLFTGINAILFVISHLLYVRSRDKMEIIDYFSLSYHLRDTSLLNKISRFLRFIKIHATSYFMIIVIIILLQATWMLLMLQLTWLLNLFGVGDVISFSTIGFFVTLEKLPYEVKFISYKSNAILDSIRSEEVLSNYIGRLKRLPWKEKNRLTFSYLMREIEKEERIQKHHHDLLKRTNVVYNVTSYIASLIMIEVIGFISWSQWLRLIL